MIAASLKKFLAFLLGLKPEKRIVPETVESRPYRLHVPRSLIHELRTITRPNMVRGEPLAFLLARFASEESRTILVGIEVLPFPEIAYVDGTAGANFDTDWAVEVANEQIVANIGLLLVHSHGGTGTPAFSGVDQQTNRHVMGALAVGVDTVPYGALVLSDTDATCVVSNARALTAVKVVVVPDRFGNTRAAA